MIEQQLSPAYLAYQEGKSVLEALAGVNKPLPKPFESVSPSPSLPSEVREVRAHVPTPHWSEDTLRNLLE